MTAAQPKVKFSIRQKLFFLVLIGFSSLIVLTSWRIGVEANSVASATITQTLAQSSMIVETKLMSRFSSIKETAQSLSRDGRVLPLVYDGDELTLQDLSYEFQKALEFDILFFTDHNGTILARSDRPDAVGRSIAGRSTLFDTALNGEPAQGIIASKNRLLQIVVVPIFDNVALDVVRGTVALAYELSPTIIKEINALTASDIGLLMFTRDEQREVNAVTNLYNTDEKLIPGLEKYFSQGSKNWTSIYQNQSQQQEIRLKINDEDFFAAIRPLAKHDGENLGFIMALKSRTELLEPFLVIQRQVIILGIICVFVASIFAWIISQHISLPIIRLVSVARGIQEGNYPSSPASKKRNDEVGILHEAIFHMGKNLKEKAELETYLAQLSEDLDESDHKLASEGLSDIHADETIVEENIPTEETVLRTVDLANTKEQKPRQKAALFSSNKTIDKRYQIIRLIGSGAMGEVYLAKDLDLNEPIALKILNKKQFTKEELNQFKEEIRLARRITHRNILRTFDFGMWDGVYYITMEYVHGHDLGKLIDKKGALSANIGVAMAKQICTAMNAAHEQGIIHRDLKPSNMMINKQGILKIMDFGLAMKISEKDAAHKGKQDQGDNATTIAGTPKYMAPEQFFGWNLDERTDVYAIGIILFTLFSGAPPFRAKNYKVLAAEHLKKEAPKLRSVLPNASEKLEQIIDKALQKAPEERYASVRLLLDDLQLV